MEINVKFMFLNCLYFISHYCSYYNYNNVENVGATLKVALQNILCVA